MNDIDWKRVEAVSLPIPQYILTALDQLNSIDSQAREEAYWQIDNVVVIQGNLGEDAPFAASEVLRRLRNGQLFDKVLTYDLLYEIGNGEASYKEMFTFPDGHTEPLMQVCRQFMEAGLDLYISDLLTQDPELRERALDLVCSCKLRKQEAESALKMALGKAPDEETRREIDLNVQGRSKEIYELRLHRRITKSAKNGFPF
ncbi:hypothetical protein KSD_07580 [Ktedonobacter sp. SOSP1-85]|uniref:hypothetical protein n=1 Tax=Ktedonobacter sp. SOSP1-85 TaxID=2778367 RepID=UPI001916B282|nr:hypothetical protein [Ktedonobacter sp. SOSP1-85]GHO72987.1 hypothetical protein KSD_07580 [Ktedonobacter sp. SOSP1-85]